MWIKTGVLAAAPARTFGRKKYQPPIVYDNNPYKEGLLTSWGFSCLVSGTKKTILFDTGGNGSVLIANMGQVGVDSEEIDIV